jgi:hypothetical protein
MYSLLLSPRLCNIYITCDIHYGSVFYSTLFLLLGCGHFNLLRTEITTQREGERCKKC